MTGLLEPDEVDGYHADLMQALSKLSGITVPPMSIPSMPSQPGQQAQGAPVPGMAAPTPPVGPKGPTAPSAGGSMGGMGGSAPSVPSVPAPAAKNLASVKTSCVNELELLGVVTDAQAEAVKLAEPDKKFVSHGDAEQALSKLRKLEREAPTAGEVGRRAAVGAAVYPVALRSIAKIRPPVSRLTRASLAGKAFDVARNVGADAVTGAGFSAGLPMAGREVERRYQVRQLKSFLKKPRASTQFKQKIRQELQKAGSAPWVPVFLDELEKLADLTSEEAKLLRDAIRMHAKLNQKSAKGTISEAEKVNMRGNTERIKAIRKKSKGEASSIPSWAKNLSKNPPKPAERARTQWRRNASRAEQQAWATSHMPKLFSPKGALILGGLGAAFGGLVGAVSAEDKENVRRRRQREALHSFGKKHPVLHGALTGAAVGAAIGGLPPPLGLLASAGLGLASLEPYKVHKKRVLEDIAKAKVKRLRAQTA